MSSTPEDVIVWALEQHTLNRMPAEQKAAAIMREFAFNGYVVVKAPSGYHKGPHDTDQSILRIAATKAESARYPVGGSNVGRAVGQVLRDVADQMDRRHTDSYGHVVAPAGSERTP